MSTSRTETSAPAEVRGAAQELVALAAAVRADWRPADVEGALAAAAVAGLTWPQALVGLARLMVDVDARPGELVPDAVRDPTRPACPVDPQLSHRRAAAIRAAAGWPSPTRPEATHPAEEATHARR